MVATGETVSLAERIIDDTCLVSTLFFRLKNDEKFLDFLKEKVIKDLEQRLEATTIKKKKKKKFQVSRAEAIKKAKAKAIKTEKDLMDVADETLDFIEQRKIFWKAQREGLIQDCDIRNSKLKKLRLTSV